MRNERWDELSQRLHEERSIPRPWRKLARRALAARFVCPGPACRVCSRTSSGDIDEKRPRCTRFAVGLVRTLDLDVDGPVAEATLAQRDAVRSTLQLPGLEFFGADRNAHDITATVTRGSDVFAFQLLASTVANRVGATRSSRFRGGSAVAQRGTLGKLALALAGGKVGEMEDKVARGSRPSRSVFAVDVVFEFLQAVVDFSRGTYEPADEGNFVTYQSNRGVQRRISELSAAKHVIMAVGNAAFTHAYRGGNTMVGKDSLLATCSRLDNVTVVSTIEDMSSQNCNVCADKVRRNGDYRLAVCSDNDCRATAHRDVMAACNMIRIIAHIIVFGKREKFFKRRVPKSGSAGTDPDGEDFEILDDRQFYSYVDSRNQSPAPLAETLAADDGNTTAAAAVEAATSAAGTHE